MGYETKTDFDEDIEMEKDDTSVLVSLTTPHEVRDGTTWILCKQSHIHLQ